MLFTLHHGFIKMRDQSVVVHPSMRPVTPADEPACIGTYGQDLKFIGMGYVQDSGLACEVGVWLTLPEGIDGMDELGTEIGVILDFVQPIIKHKDRGVVAHGFVPWFFGSRSQQLSG
jgi:hypothetical protein